MKERTLKGDWYHLVKSDFQKANLKMDDQNIAQTDFVQFKCDVKKAVWKAFYGELQEKKLTHIKVKHIQYSGQRLPQAYLTNPKFDNEMCSLLLNLRCSSVNDFMDNFHSLYGKTPPCKTLCGENIDSQSHALACKSVLRKLTQTEVNLIKQVEYSDLFGSVDQQYQITSIYKRIIEVRKGLPGLYNSGPD